MIIDIQDKMKGSFLGLAWGDALGTPVETWKPEQIKKVFGDFLTLPIVYPYEKMFTEVAEDLFKRLRPLGVTSDDTQQAMALLNICLSGWNTDTWANYMKAGMNVRADVGYTPWRGYGSKFKHACDNLSKGISLKEAGSASSGIGAAMRIAPLGALFHDNIPNLKRIVVESTLMTHADLSCVAYTYAIAFVVSQFINGESVKEVTNVLPLVVYDFEQELLNNYQEWKFNRNNAHLISSCLSLLLSQDINDTDSIRKQISQFARPYLHPDYPETQPNQPFVLLGGIHALIMGLQENVEPNDILSSIVKEGYDTDTVAAISGGILGARFGSKWIPVNLLVDKKRIIKYADSLINNKVETIEDFMRNEAILTRQDDIFAKEVMAKYHQFKLN